MSALPRVRSLLGRGQTLPVRTYLVLLAVVTVAPLALFASMLVLNQARNESAERERAMRETARALALAVDEYLTGALTGLEAVAASSFFEASAAPAELQAEIERSTSTHEGWRSVWLFTQKGELVVSTALAVDELGPASLPVVRQVIERGSAVIAPVLAGQRTSGGQAAENLRFAVAAPVYRGGDVRYVLVASIDNRGPARILQRQSIARSWQAVIVDPRGTYAARSVGPEIVGQPSGLFRQAGGAAGWHRGIDGDGEPVYFAYERAPISGWGVGIIVPREELDAPFRRSMLGVIGAGLLSLAAGMVVAAILGRQLSRPLRSLTAEVSNLERGPPAPMPTGSMVEEIAVLARAFERAAQAFEERARVRRELEGSARERQAWYAALAALAPVGLMRCDPTGRCTYVNERWTQITGLTLEDSQDGRWAGCLHPEERDRLIAEWTTALRAGHEIAGEFRYRHSARDADDRWLSAYARPVTDGDGRVLEYIGVVLDTTERRRAEEERAELVTRAEAARLEAEAANRAKDDFLATLSHELRTPLNALLLWVEVLRETTPDPAMYRRAIESIERSARQQAQLVEALLDIARLTSGKFTIDPRPIDLVPVVRSAVDSARDTAERKGIELMLDLGPPCVLRGDPERLQQVILNLLSNAIRFTPAGGRIDVAVRCSPPDAVLTVADTGEGIAPEFVGHIFERFRQADSSAGRRHGGLGLGLAIARDIVELHGGRIRADSEGRGRGSTFTIALPLAPLPAEVESASNMVESEPAQARGQPTPRLGGLLILLAEDDQDARELITRALRRCGAQVVPAVSAHQALDMLDRVHPDLLVSDIGMAGMDGYELLRRIRSAESGAGVNIPAIALTGYASAADRDRALAAGFHAHVTKPVDAGHLVHLIAEVTKRA